MKIIDATHSRRNFLSTSAKLGLALPLLPFGVLDGIVHAKPKRKLKILILGGTSFLGPHQIAYALERGHSVTTFTRGKTKPTVHADLFDDVEMLIGDRVDNLEALKNRNWDVVIDNSGREVKWTEDTAELLKNHAERYLYVSSVSVFYPYYKVGANESDTIVLEMPEKLEEGEKPLYDYGIMKANSELAASRIFGEDRAISVRPTFMTGPADRTDRFMYWPTQLAKGGDILVPGLHTDQVQFIDVRDMAEFMIRLLENEESGTYSGVGPGSFMNSSGYAHSAANAFDTQCRFIKVNDHDFLRDQNLTFLPPWVLPQDKFLGICRVDNQKALDAGLTFRSLEETIKDTHDWWYSDTVEAERRMKFDENIQAQIPAILKAWEKR